jgi:hypothetical protein
MEKLCQLQVIRVKDVVGYCVGCRSIINGIVIDAKPMPRRIKEMVLMKWQTVFEHLPMIQHLDVTCVDIISDGLRSMAGGGVIDARGIYKL